VRAISSISTTPDPQHRFAALARADLNIDNLLNTSRDEYAFTLIDLDTQPSTETLNRIRSTKGVLSARVLPKSRSAPDE
jgi:D-3-phosphoglycerate dehydrogenase